MNVEARASNEGLAHVSWTSEEESAFTQSEAETLEMQGETMSPDEPTPVELAARPSDEDLGRAFELLTAQSEAESGVRETQD